MNHLTSKGDILEINHAFSGASLAIIKATNTRWYAGKGIWKCADTPRNRRLLAELSWDIEPGLPKLPELPNQSIPEFYQENLRDYQLEMLKFTYKHAGRLLLADDMGLGKTVQAVAWLGTAQNTLPALIICPANVKSVWFAHCQEWLQNKYTVHIINGKTIKPLVKADIYIINYYILQYWYNVLQNIGFQTTILDESVMAKNNHAKRTQKSLAIGKKSKYMLALCGTPIKNRPYEAYPVLHALRPELFNWHDYVKRYCGAHCTKYGVDKSGAANEKEFADLLRQTVMLRRTKADVKHSLPAKTIKHKFIGTPTQEYKHAEEDFIDWLLTKKSKAQAKSTLENAALARLEKLKQLAINSKWFDLQYEILKTLKKDDRLVVWVWHRVVAKKLQENFKRYNPIMMIGGNTHDQREKKRLEFKEDTTHKLLIANMSVAEFGIDLSFVNQCVFIELDWSPFRHFQCIDRLHRGRQTKPVLAEFWICPDTIESKILNLLQRKETTINAMIEGRHTEYINIFEEIIKSYTGG